MDFGYTLLAGVGLFASVGWWLDGRFQSKPWFFLGGIALGLAVGFNGLFKKLNYLERRPKPPKEGGPKSDSQDPKP